MIGMVIVESKFKDKMPSVDNYKSDVSYCLPFNGCFVAVNGCFTKEFSHSWDIPTQRYAYDFVKLDENGMSFKGDYKDVGDYYCYGQEILSPADGTVVEVEGNWADSIIMGKGRFISKAKHIAGNFIVIQHSENEFSTLAHLKKDSFKVAVGDKVLRGQVVALCGNSGNSTEPHLHFQLQTGRSFYNSAGLPIHFQQIEVSEVDGYSAYDPRHHMNIDSVPKGYITRGFSATNVE